MNPLESLKKLTGLINTVENATLKKEMSELYLSFEELHEKCNDLREKNISSKEEIQKLKEEIASLKEKNSILEKELERKESVELKDGAYWTLDGKKGPYCQVCFDTKEKLIQTAKMQMYNKMQCPVCGHKYETAQQRAENQQNQKEFFDTIGDFNK